MKYLVTQKGIVILLAYLLGGLALGLADPYLGRWMQHWGMKAGLATVASVNVLRPLLAIGLGAIHPRAGSACLGAVAMTWAFIIGLALSYPPPNGWDPLGLLCSIQPVLVIACFGYAL